MGSSVAAKKRRKILWEWLYSISHQLARTLNLLSKLVPKIMFIIIRLHVYTIFTMQRGFRSWYCLFTTNRWYDDIHVLCLEIGFYCFPDCTQELLLWVAALTCPLYIYTLQVLTANECVIGWRLYSPWLVERVVAVTCPLKPLVRWSTRYKKPFKLPGSFPHIHLMQVLFQ